MALKADNTRLRARVMFLESEARPEALAEARHIVSTLEKEVAGMNDDNKDLERQIQLVEDHCSASLGANRKEHEQRLLALRHAHEGKAKWGGWGVGGA